MKLFAYCIVSHNRPLMLKAHLSAISSVIRSSGTDQVSIFVFDNSTGDNSSLIRSIVRPHTQLLQTEGASVSTNFGKILQIPKHHYCIIAHDDDSCYIHDLPGLLDFLRSIPFGTTLAARSLHIDDSYYRSSINRNIPLIPFHLSIYPWRLPAFPAWIYPMNKLFYFCINEYLLTFPAGKYSDVIFVHRLLTSLFVEFRTTPVLAPGMTYLYRIHSDQDTSFFMLRPYLMMLNSIDGLRRHHFLAYVLDLTKKILYTCFYKSLRRSLHGLSAKQ